MIAEINEPMASDHKTGGSCRARSAILQITHAYLVTEGGLKENDEMSVDVVESHLFPLLPVRQQ